MSDHATRHPGRRDVSGRHLTRDDVLDGRAVAELLHLPISTVLDYARRGLIPGHKLGRRWIFIRDEIEAAVRAAPSEPPVRKRR